MSEMEVMPSGIEREAVDVREHKPRRALLWCAVALTFVGVILTTTSSLLVSAWKQRPGSFRFEKAAEAVKSYPMQVGPLIAGKNKATVGELVYLTRVLLKPGPTPTFFFLAGSQGTQILITAEGTHVVARPGQMVDVRGTIRKTPSVPALRKQWKLSLAEAKRVSDVPIYIESDFIRGSGG